MTEHNHDAELTINNEENYLRYMMKTEMKFYTVKC